MTNTPENQNLSEEKPCNENHATERLNQRCLIDGELTEQLPGDDRGLLYGDGFFTTIRVHDGAVLLGQYHRQRLQRSASVLGFPELDFVSLSSRLNAAVGDWQDAIVRLTVTRGSAPRGYAPPQNPAPRVVIQSSRIQPRNPESSPVALAVASARLSENTQLAGLKHLNRLEQVLAAAEIVDSEADDLVMALGNQAICTTRCNLYCRFGEQWLTPSVERAGVAGTTRAWMIEQWPALSIAPITLETLHAADEILLSNALIGVQAVGKISERSVTVSSIAEQLNAKLLGCGRPLERALLEP